MYVNWNLDREKVKKILQHLAQDRAHQTTITNLLGATRFKTVKKGVLHHTLCPKCGAVDSWEHCIWCYNLKVDTQVEENAWLSRVKNIAEAIVTDNPSMYTAADIEHAGRRG